MNSDKPALGNASTDARGERPVSARTRMLRRLLCGLAITCGLGIAPGAAATSVTTDQSDLWYVATESGWGMQLVQRDAVIFATVFVYDFANRPTWYVATINYQGNLVWTGDLLATAGPWFGTVPFDSAAVAMRKAGTMTWTSTSTTTGALSYTVDGVSVTKNVVRQSLAYEDYAGHYAGGIHMATTGCVNPMSNAVSENIGVMYVTQLGQAVTLTQFPLQGGSCTYSGTLTQAGQMGSFPGSYSCSLGEAGSFVVSEMQVNISGLTGRITSQSPSLPGCQSAGWFGGMRVTGF